MRTTANPILLVVLALAACGGTEQVESDQGESDPIPSMEADPRPGPTSAPAPSPCEEAFEAAATADPTTDTWENWFPAIEICSLDEWVATAKKFPYPEYEASLAVDPEGAARNLCAPYGAAAEIASEATLCNDLN
jgi:hypothetical protein